MYASMYGANVEIPPLCVRGSNRVLTDTGTVYGGQFDWGGLLPKSNGGVRR